MNDEPVTELKEPLGDRALREWEGIRRLIIRAPVLVAIGLTVVAFYVFDFRQKRSQAVDSLMVTNGLSSQSAVFPLVVFLPEDGNALTARRDGVPPIIGVSGLGLIWNGTLTNVDIEFGKPVTLEMDGDKLVLLASKVNFRDLGGGRGECNDKIKITISGPRALEDIEHHGPVSDTK